MRKPAPTPVAVTMALVITLVLGACGSEEISEPGTGTGQGAAEGSEGEQGTPLEVRATDFSFSPASLSVDTSESATVILSNEGEAAHSFTSDELGMDIEAAPGETQEAGFTAPAEDSTYSFYCRFHPDRMTGKIIVGTGGTGTDDGDTGEGAGENDTGIDY